MPSSRGSSQPRDQTKVSHISGRFSPDHCLILSLHEHISLYLFLITVANQYDIPYVLTLSSLSLSHLFFDFRSHFYLLKW